MAKSPHPTREVLHDARAASLKMVLDSALSDGERGSLIDIAVLKRSLEALKGRLEARVIFDDGESMDITQALLGNPVGNPG